MMTLLLNALPEFTSPLPDWCQESLGKNAPGKVKAMLAVCPQHQETPLLKFPELAKELGIAGLFVKDEGKRLGLKSFKALGGAYAVFVLVQRAACERLKRNIHPSELQSDHVKEIAKQIVVCCATDGNHGRSVAAGARIAGCAAKIFVHAGVSQSRIDAIRNFGAEIISVQGTYDDAVNEASSQAALHGWQVVSDTSWPGYRDIPTLAMQGYTVLVDEALDQISGTAMFPTHVFLQAGVGGFAASIAAYLTLTLGARAPKIIIVEPKRAACIYESVRAGKPIKIEHDESTVMAMLECYEPSVLAWEILARTAHAFMLVDEADAVSAMRQFAKPLPGDPSLESGESGCVGLAGLQRLMSEEDAKALSLDKDSVVLLINTEGATDEAIYRSLIE
jgi:diaminopropionate ammonia-lyase